MSEQKMSFRVTGMTCTTCSKIVERALSKVEGVSYASVNLATESVFVAADGSVTFEILENAVEKSGYKILKEAPADIDDIKYREARKDLFFILLIGIPMSVLMFMHMAMGIHYHWYGIMEIVAGGLAIFVGRAQNTPRGMDRTSACPHKYGHANSYQRRGLVGDGPYELLRP